MEHLLQFQIPLWIIGSSSIAAVQVFGFIPWDLIFHAFLDVQAVNWTPMYTPYTHIYIL